LINDFEKPVFQQYPAIAKLKQTLYDTGAVYASLTGSGSALFGIYISCNIQPNLFEKDTFVKIIPAAKKSFQV
jgi:4-diphosphocytidyl-2-C-methyl-D-erythritol kinase